MNEEMKIIIKAVTDSAKKSIEGVKKELEGVGKTAGGVSQKVGAAFKGIAKGAAVAVAAVAAIGTALVALGKNTLEIQKSMAQLNTAFQAAGLGAETAAKTYQQFYRFLGDSDTATEASNLLVKLTQDEQKLTEWTKTLQGVYATFPDSLPIEALVESANESARVGKITGNLADALVWAGESEDAFNAKLAQTTTLSEREALIRETLNGLYGEAGEIYEKNNKALLDYNESQARMDSTMASAGQAILPLMTALNNLGSAFFTALKPALDVIIPVLANFVNWIAKGIQAVTSFFSAITGSSTKVKAFGTVGGTAAQQVANGMTGAKDATTGAQKAAGGAAKAIEEAKKSTQGFDELNIVASGKSSSGGGSGGGASSPAYSGGGGSGGGGGLIDNMAFGTEVEESTSKGNALLERFKLIGEQLSQVFAPSIEAWSGAFSTIRASWDEAIPYFQNGLIGFKNGFLEIGTYIAETFVPDIVNSFSVNLAPVFGDVLGFSITELGKTFEWLGGIFDNVSTNIIVPALETVKTVATDIFDGIGKAWEKHGQPLLDNLGIAFESIRVLLTTIYENAIEPIFNKVKSVVDDLWANSIKPVYDNLVDAVMEIGRCLLQLYNKFIAPVVQWIADNIVPLIVEHIGKIIDVIGNILSKVMIVVNGIIDFCKGLIQFITGIFTGDWSKAWEGIQNMFSGCMTAIEGIFSSAWAAIQGVWTIAASWFGTVWESIQKVFSVVGTWFSDIFSTAWEGTKKAFSSAASWFGTVYQSIQKVFSGCAEWFRGIFSSAWSAVLNVFSAGGRVFKGIAEGVLKVFKTVVNFLIDGINKVVKLPFEGLNNILDRIYGIDIAGVKPFSWLTWRAPVPQLPKLAKGGIVDSATIAMIGEQGKEAVVPLENNTEWIDKLANRLSDTTGAPTKIILQLDGKALGEATINSINNITKQTGSLQLVLA